MLRSLKQRGFTRVNCRFPLCCRFFFPVCKHHNHREEIPAPVQGCPWPQGRLGVESHFLQSTEQLLCLHQPLKTTGKAKNSTGIPWSTTGINSGTNTQFPAALSYPRNPKHLTLVITHSYPGCLSQLPLLLHPGKTYWMLSQKIKKKHQTWDILHVFSIVWLVETKRSRNSLSLLSPSACFPHQLKDLSIFPPPN